MKKGNKKKQCKRKKMHFSQFSPTLYYFTIEIYLNDKIPSLLS